MDALLPLLADKSRTVRRSTLIALGQIGDERAVTSIISMATNEQTSEKAHAIDALRAIGGKSAITALELFREDSSFFVRRRARTALRETKKTCDVT